MQSRVDLRACGGTVRLNPISAPWMGRSPRVRRNLGFVLLVAVCVGSISARAEEPLQRGILARSMEVDLRACGGTLDTASHMP